MEMLKRVFNSEIRAIDEKEMTLTAIVSTSSVDRMGDIVDVKGIDLRHFRKNPVVLWAHNSDKPPIGKALWIKRQGEALIAKVKFATSEFAQEIFDLHKGGFLNAFSIGFIPKESEPMDERDSSMFSPQRFIKSELLEFSSVPVPANPEALQMAMMKGIIRNKSTQEQLERGWTEKHDDTTVTFNDLGSFRFLNDEGEEIYTLSDGTSMEEKTLTSASLKPTSPTEEEKDYDELGDLVSENEELVEKVNDLIKERELLLNDISKLRYKVYELTYQKQKDQDASSEIAVDDLAEITGQIIGRAIRKAQGQVE